MSAREHLSFAEEALGTGADQTALASAVTGVLAAIVEHTDDEARIERLQDEVSELDSVIRRCLNLADWHESKAQKARDYPGGPENTARMAKAAEVHSDAARRLREAVDGGAA